MQVKNLFYIKIIIGNLHEYDKELYKKLLFLINDFYDDDNNVKLSGVQKQRISICRTILRKPKILLLNKSTSTLDIGLNRRTFDVL